MMMENLRIEKQGQVKARSEPLFHSILFSEPSGGIGNQPLPFLRDLNLDQILEGVAALRKNYDLTPFLHAPLTSLDSILYRQEIARDLEAAETRAAVADLCESLRKTRQSVENAEKGEYKFARSKQFLNAVDTYCQALETFSERTSPLEIQSRGLRAFCWHVARILESSDFRKLVEHVGRVKKALGDVKYDLVLGGDSVTVRPFGDEAPYKPIIEKTFERFRRNAVKSYEVKLPTWGGMNHIEAQILERVALHYPDTLNALEEFWSVNSGFLDQKVSVFESEVQLYLAYLEFIEPLRASGLKFCYPSFSVEDKEIDAKAAFDLALAMKLQQQKTPTVTNDFHLHGQERILVVTGPNHGGKTTFARMFGQIHYLAVLGFPVPAEEARLLLFDQIYTHFEREEDITNLRGKLQDELVRMHEILEKASPRSIFVLNEIFSSTTIRDSIYLSRKIMQKISEIDLVAICVTFVDELSRFNEKTVSMVSAISPQNPAIRTFKVERRPADGLAYALAIAEKYHVTYEWLRKRVKA